MKREVGDKIENHPLLESLLSACHLCSCGTDIYPQWFADAGKQG